MTRNGKIARLPKCVRDELNERLRDGETGTGLVKWLNDDGRVKEVLAKLFGGREISPQNLSEWRQGGYQDWLRHQESCERVRFLSEQADELHDAADGLCVSERLATVLAVDMAETARSLLSEAKDTKERWKHLRELLQEVARLRRGDQRQGRLRMAEQKWDIEVRRSLREEAERLSRETREAAMGPFYRELGQLIKASTLGAWKAVAKDLEEGEKRREEDQGESEWIKPDRGEAAGGNQLSVGSNQTRQGKVESNADCGSRNAEGGQGKWESEKVGKGAEESGNGEAGDQGESEWIKPDQTARVDAQDPKSKLQDPNEEGKVGKGERETGAGAEESGKGQGNGECGGRKEWGPHTVFYSSPEAMRLAAKEIKEQKAILKNEQQSNGDAKGESANGGAGETAAAANESENGGERAVSQDESSSVKNGKAKIESEPPRRRMGPGAWTNTTHFW